MSTIGGYGVFSIRGSMPMAGNLATKHTRSGVPGFDAHDIGWGGQPKTLTVIALYSSHNNRLAGIINFNALKKTFISVVDDRGEQWDNLYVEDVRITSEQNAVLSIPAGDEYRLKFEIDLDPSNALGYP